MCPELFPQRDAVRFLVPRKAQQRGRTRLRYCQDEQLELSCSGNIKAHVNLLVTTASETTHLNGINDTDT